MGYAEAEFDRDSEDAFRLILDVIGGINKYAIQRVSPLRVIQATGGRDYDAYVAIGAAGGLIGVPFVFLLLYALFDMPHFPLLNFLYWGLVWTAFVVIGLTIYYASRQSNSIHIELLESMSNSCRLGFTTVGRGGAQLKTAIVEKLSNGRWKLEAAKDSSNKHGIV